MTEDALSVVAPGLLGPEYHAPSPETRQGLLEAF